MNHVASPSLKISDLKLGDKVLEASGEVVSDLLPINYGYISKNTHGFEIAKDVMGFQKEMYLSKEEIIALYNFAMGNF